MYIINQFKKFNLKYGKLERNDYDKNQIEDKEIEEWLVEYIDNNIFKEWDWD